MFPEHFVIFNAKDKLSGDIHYFQRRGDNCLAAVIDCTGHGIPGAMLTMIVTSIFNEILSASKNVGDPANILKEVDRRLYSIIHNDENEMQINDGLDIALICYNKQTSTVEFAGAHRPLYHYRDGKINVIKGARTGLGSGDAADQDIKNHKVKVEKGDKLYIFTDGFPDQFGGENNSKYMIGRFRKLLCRLAPFPLADQKKLLEDEFLNWKGEYPQTDDVLVVGLTF